MVLRIPEIRPLSDLARDARGLVARMRDRQEPIVITQRGRDVAVLLPVEVYRELERRLSARIDSPRLVDPHHAARFAKTVEVISDVPHHP